MKLLFVCLSFLLALSCQGIPQQKEKEKALLMFRVDLSQSRLVGRNTLSFFVDYTTGKSLPVVNGMNYLFLDPDRINSIRFNIKNSSFPNATIAGRSTTSFKLEAGKVYYLPYVTKYSDESYGYSAPYYRIGGQSIKESELDRMVKSLEAEAGDRGYIGVEIVKMLTQSELDEANYKIDIYLEDN